MSGYSHHRRLAIGCGLACVLLLGQWAAGAEPKAAAVFGDGMVLQRDMPLPVWGTADDGVAVKVELAGHTASGQAADGKWRVALPAMKASSKPLTMTITYGSGDKPTVQTIGNILVGEVWWCAGQSNMAQIINQRPPREVGDMPQVRQFNARPRGNAAIGWIVADAEHLGQFSITALYFGEGLHKKLDVPIGLVLTAVSGSPIERWIPRQVLEADPKTKPLLEMTGDREKRAAMNELSTRVRAGEDIKPDEQQLWLAKSFVQSSQHYRQVVEPVVPFAARGVIWYQGESNARDAFEAVTYDHYLSLLIRSWRDVFGQPNLPFYIVQLPSIEERKRTRPAHYEIIRQKQLDVIRTVPHTGLAVTIDINQGLHPRNKDITGERLAMLALAETYGMKGEGKPTWCAPLSAEATFKDGAAICRFDFAGTGLDLRDTEEKLFELAGTDGQWHAATAKVDGDKVIVTSTNVPQPRAVRYAYSAVVKQPALFGSTGLPASPFVFEE